MVRALRCVGSSGLWWGVSVPAALCEQILVLARVPDSCSLVPRSAPGPSSSCRKSQAGEDTGPRAGHNGNMWVGAGWAPAATGAADFQTFLLCVAGTTSAHNMIKRLKSLSSAASSK